MNYTLELKSIKDTDKLAVKIAHACKNNNLLIFLFGDMGSGKTTLSQHIIKNIYNNDMQISSPTYSFMNTYSGGYNIYHFDLYRLKNSAQIFELGLHEYIENNNAIRIIEWPDLINFIKPDIIIKLSTEKNHKRANIETISIDI